MFEPILLPEIPAGFPFPLEAEEIPYETARRAYLGTSFSPERRGKNEQAGYLSHLIALWLELLPLADTAERREMLAAELSRYRDGYRKRCIDLLHAKSRCLSTMIAGPSNFPVRRAEKANNAEHRRSVELCDWSKRAQAAIRKSLAPPAPTPNDELARLTEQRDLMKAVNVEYRKVKGDIDAMTVPSEKLRAAMKAARENYWLGKERFVPFESFELTSINGKIKRLQANAEREVVNAEAECREVMVGDVRVVEDPAADRLQLFYSEKPDRGLINSLKAAGLRWTPSIGAWQAYRTSNGFASVARVLGVEDLRPLLRGAP